MKLAEGLLLAHCSHCEKCSCLKDCASNRSETAIGGVATLA